MPADYFGDQVAKHYDDSDTGMFATAEIEAAVTFLAGLAGSGGALELGIGTGRIALPLSRRGVRVHGIDLSAAMIAKLKAKAGAQQIAITLGDFANTRAPGTFNLAFLVFNTIMNLTTQDEQVACFDNVARHLEPGGYFVIEVGIPDLRRLPPGETVRPFAVTPKKLGFDTYDVATQGLVSHHYATVGNVLDVHSIPFRYVWPSELDLMARLAGMSLDQRWSSWDRQPFTNESRQHISVWRK